MKILYVASEGAPYSASGGLGDVIGALPKAVASMDKETTVEVILPLYGSMKKEHRDIFIFFSQKVYYTFLFF